MNSDLIHIRDMQPLMYNAICECATAFVGARSYIALEVQEEPALN